MKLSELKIGIAGCGGIGSNVAAHLIRSGITNFVIADFDVIEESNLNRQFFFYDQIGMEKAETLKKNLLLINPNAKIKAETIKITGNHVVPLFSGCHILVEAFDKKESKKELVEAAACHFSIVVGCSGLAGFTTDKIIEKRFGNHLIIIGDFESDSDDNALFSHKVGLTACLMTEAVLREGLKL